MPMVVWENLLSLAPLYTKGWRVLYKSCCYRRRRIDTPVCYNLL